MVDFTVAIPTYNGANRLPEVLERLRSQVFPQPIYWEVIVVDNNSNDHTADVVSQYQKDFPCPLHYCLETQQGAAFARKRAIQVALGEIIGFLDDDNIPALDWVAQAIAFAEQHPRAGAWGSQIHPDYEVPPPEGFHQLQPYLAIVERGSKPKLYDPKKLLLPPSAGLVIRRSIWLAAVPSDPILSGRVEGNMLTGEDLEAIAHIQRAGWEVWYNPAMEMHHKIPARRLELSYLLPFFRGIGLSRYVTRMVNVAPWLRPIATLLYAANDLRKLLLHLLTYRASAWTDLVPACQLQLYLGSLQSPFFLYTAGYLAKKPSASLPVLQAQSLTSQP